MKRMSTTEKEKEEKEHEDAVLIKSLLKIWKPFSQFTAENHIGLTPFWRYNKQKTNEIHYDGKEILSCLCFAH